MTIENRNNLTRRQMLKVGVLGSGLTLGRYLELAAQSEKEAGDSGRSAILVFLAGGPSHQDTFDLKPDAPAEYRGRFRPITTSASGVDICEHLPKLARAADQYAVVRGISHNLAAHGLGQRYLMTGNRPTPVLRYPMYGSVVSKELPGADELPSFVSIERPVDGPGYLGAEFGPLSTGEKPRYGRPFRVRGITLDEGLTLEKFQTRSSLRKDLDTAFAGYEKLDEPVRGLNRFSEKAYQIISSKKSRDAFELSKEPDAESVRFGRHETGQSLLLTTRLIEAGVRFVTVIVDGWDTHQNNFDELAGRLLPPLDQALSALLARLQDRGLLDSTSVLVTGEFGRTPKVNGRGGRDHWARAMCSLMAGGDVRGGQVLGRTNDKAEEPLEGEGFSPDDLAASFLQNIGIDPKKEYDANVGRPITLIRDGSPIDGLLA